MSDDDVDTRIRKEAVAIAESDLIRWRVRVRPADDTAGDKWYIDFYDRAGGWYGTSYKESRAEAMKDAAAERRKMRREAKLSEEEWQALASAPLESVRFCALCSARVSSSMSCNCVDEACRHERPK